MNFELTKEQAMIRKLIRDFSQEEVAPEADERDRTGMFPKEVLYKISCTRNHGTPVSRTVWWW